MAADAERRDAAGAGVDRVQVAAVAAERDGALATAEGARPAPPVANVPAGESDPSAARSKRCTALPAGSLVCV